MQKKLIEKLSDKKAPSGAMMLAGWIETIKDKDYLIIDLYENQQLAYRFAENDTEEGLYIPEHSSFAKAIGTGWMKAMNLSAKTDFVFPMTYYKGTRDAINNFLGCNIKLKYDSIVETIRDQTHKISNKNYQALHKSKQQTMEMHLTITEKPLAKRFESFCYKVVEEHLFFLNPFKGHKTSTGMCSCCGKEVMVDRSFSIGKTLHCPSCKKKVTVVSNRKTSAKENTERVIVIQGIKNQSGYVIRHFDVSHKIENRTESFKVLEVGRKLYIEGKLFTYLNKFDYSGAQYWDYCGNDMYDSSPINIWQKGLIYPYTLRNIMGYNLAEQMGNKYMIPDPQLSILDSSIRGIFAREGLEGMLNNTLLKSKGKSLEEILEINRDSINMLKNLNYHDMNAVRWLRWAEANQYPLEIGELKWLQYKVKFVKKMYAHHTLTELFSCSKAVINRAINFNLSLIGIEWLSYLEAHNETITDDKLYLLSSYLCSPKEIPETLSYLGLNKLLETMTIGKVPYYSYKEYMLRMEKYPIMEFLLKAGLLALAANLRSQDIDFTAGTGINALGINKEQYNRLKAHNGDCIMLEWLRHESRSGIRLDDEVLIFYSSHYIRPDGKYLCYTSPRKAMNYILKQTEMCNTQSTPYWQRKTIGQVEQEWKDYIQMAEKAKYNLNSDLMLKPKNLHAAHQELANDEKAKLRREEIIKNFPHVEEIMADVAKKYSYTGEQYSIVCPLSVEDIVKEGSALGHCLANNDLYFNYIQSRQSYIVFLRRNSEIDKPWYTIEIEPSTTIRQKRTTGDNQDSSYEEAVKFLIEWQKKIGSSLSKEDLDLGVQSEILRNKNFEELFKNKTQIRNGLFKGQLLGDVLKKDLLVAPAAISAVA